MRAGAVALNTSLAGTASMKLCLIGPAKWAVKQTPKTMEKAGRIARIKRKKAGNFVRKCGQICPEMRAILPPKPVYITNHLNQWALSVLVETFGLVIESRFQNRHGRASLKAAMGFRESKSRERSNHKFRLQEC